MQTKVTNVKTTLPEKDILASELHLPGHARSTRQTADLYTQVFLIY